MEAHAFTEAVADAYSIGEPPSDQLCDQGFALADRVDALAIEVQLRRRAVGGDQRAELGRVDTERIGVRFQARAHMTALREAARRRRPVGHADVTAAEHLYDLIVEHTRQETYRVVAHALNGPNPGATVTDIAITTPGDEPN